MMVILKKFESNYNYFNQVHLSFFLFAFSCTVYLWHEQLNIKHFLSYLCPFLVLAIVSAIVYTCIAVQPVAVQPVM